MGVGHAIVKILASNLYFASDPPLLASARYTASCDESYQKKWGIAHSRGPAMSARTNRALPLHFAVRLIPTSPSDSHSTPCQDVWEVSKLPRTGG